MKKAYLVLEDGSVFEGFRFGSENDAVGELIFDTGICGYVGGLSDPACAGRIVTYTFPVLGASGANAEDTESNVFAAGCVVREIFDSPTNFRSEESIDAFCKKHGISGICGIDTRELTELLRQKGAMKAAISDTESCDLNNHSVTGKYEAPHRVIGNGKHKVLFVDLGSTKSVIEAVASRNCTVTTVSADSFDGTADGFDGIVISSGVYRPTDALIASVGKAFGKKPMLGIGIGHEAMALSSGASAEKLLHGHHGANIPVKCAFDGKTYITAQNHGYTVTEIIKGDICFENLNDGSCEGIDYGNAISVQFVPSFGDNFFDTSFIYDRFVGLMEEK